MARREPPVRDTKQRIIDAALDVFGERGFHGATVDDVAAAAGMTKGAVYYWFVDKDDLARDLQHLLWDRLATAALGAYDPEGTTVGNLLACYEAFLGAIQQMPRAMIFLREAWVTPSLDAAGRADYRDLLVLVEGFLRQGIERGDMPPMGVEALARAVTGALMETTFYVLEGGDGEGALAVVGHLVSSLANSGHRAASSSQVP